ncbi:hypothetical protein B0H14DRAFT_2576294 [Mycena olivaceomarginata]|nr:hypothetical protein B0H14DRAFT_2576294 [Mycena olivaceomarginata]
MRELWKHELDVNECEAASAPGIISRFNLLSGASLSPNSNNVDEDTLRIAMENGGQLATAPTVNEMCALTVHPRIGKGLQTCRRNFEITAYTYIIQGQIRGFQHSAADNDLGNLPTFPMPSSPLLYGPSVISTDTKTLAPKKKQPRAPEVNEALIIEGSRLRTKSRRALGEQ